MARVFLGLGANLGDRRGNLCRAMQFLGDQVRLTAVSSVYDTAPVGDTDQPRFLNLVCEGETALSPVQLLAFVKETEAKVGRVASRRWGPRAIDIDILLYGCEVVSLPDLTIPHPRICERVFVLAPLAEIAPDLTIPGQRQPVATLLSQLPSQDVRRLAYQEGVTLPCSK
jgi:2-amino-4-hydroxy-6-hydroxymethyldihydropteridine diphosphokinase